MKKVAAFGKYKTIWAAAILLVLVLMSTMSTGSLKARFTSSSAGNDAARMAAFVFHVGEPEGHFVTQVDIENPGDTCSYEFVVTNKEGNVVCETDQKYTITVKVDGSIPVEAALKKGTTLINTAYAATGATVVYTGNDTVMEASTEATHTYTLDVQWPETEKDPKYAGGVAKVEIDIVSVQVD